MIGQCRNLNLMINKLSKQKMVVHYKNFFTWSLSSKVRIWQLDIASFLLEFQEHFRSALYNGSCSILTNQICHLILKAFPLQIT